MSSLSTHVSFLPRCYHFLIPLSFFFSVLFRSGLWAAVDGLCWCLAEPSTFQDRCCRAFWPCPSRESPLSPQLPCLRLPHLLPLQVTRNSGGTNEANQRARHPIKSTRARRA